MSVPATLEARQLCKRYRGRAVVEDVSVDVRAGEVVGLLGPNGAGKTTCFYMLAGLIPADSGSILFEGRDITRDDMHRRARQGLGYLPQEPSVFRRMTVSDNLWSVLELRPDLDEPRRREALEQLLEAFRIGHVANQLGQSLSGGERRRTEVARALAARPRTMLLDEPFAGVDPISIGELQGMVGQLRDQGIGVLITDHNVRETLGICDRAYVIGGGRIIAAGPPAAVLADEGVKEKYLGRDFRL